MHRSHRCACGTGGLALQPLRPRLLRLLSRRYPMSPRRLLAALHLPLGSALPEPTADEVYEGRLVPSPRAGEDLLARHLGAPVRILHLSDDPLPQEEWAPWCKECQETHPSGVTTDLETAAQLARSHDIDRHDGWWTADALPAAEVAALVASLPNGGAR